jgi:isocitrate lyase
LQTVRDLKAKYGNTWNAINPESAARMVTQNRFKTGLDIIKYTAAIMKKDMAEYDANASKYTVTRLLAWFCCPTKYDCC